MGPRQLELPPNEPLVDSAGSILHRVGCPVHVEHVRVLGVVLAERPHAVVAQELARIEHPPQQALHPVPAHERQEPPLPDPGLVPARDQSREVWALVQQPFEAPGEIGQPVQ